jgi:tRNA-dihydrouridine synthase B
VSGRAVPEAGCPAGYSLGPLAIRPALVLAPMAGLTDATFRRVVRRCGGVGLVVSEILSSEGLVRGTMRSEEYLRIGSDEHPVALQLSGSDPERMAEAARRCVEEGADVVDINMGCPAHKITKGMCGVALLRDTRAAAAVAGAVVRAVSVPVTVKMRLGWSDKEITFVEVARALVQEGVAGLALHGRTKEQGYSGRASWDRIAELKAAVPVPVVGNGDVTTPEAALDLWRQTNCDAVMVGRAAVKNPWIFRQIEDLRTTGAYATPTVRDRVDLILDHFADLMALGPQGLALHRMKTFLGKYTAGLPGASSLRGSLEAYKEPQALLEGFKIWADNMGLEHDATALTPS